MGLKREDHMFTKVIVVLIVLCNVNEVLPYPTFVDRLPHGTNVPHPCQPGCVWTAPGHKKIDASDKELDPFGTAFRNLGNVYSSTLCNLDSDGDGRTNGEELGDPSCLWTQASGNPPTNDPTGHPGICEPTDSSACRARLLALAWDPCSETDANNCVLTSTLAPGQGPEDCIDTFVMFPNTLSYDGFLVTSARSVDQCRDVCLGNSSCEAFDFDTKNLECYMQFYGYLRNVDDQGNDVDQYRRVECDVNATTASSVTPGCVDKFERYPNTLAYDGVPIDDADSLEECRGRCRSNLVCYAFDFDFIRRICYIHSAGYLSRLGQNSNGVDQYRRIPCVTTTTQLFTTRTPGTCVDEFQLIRNTHAFDGTLQQGLNTIASCQEMCRSLESCVAFDFDTVADLCYTHTKESLEYTEGGDGVDQYRRIPCSADETDCVDTFDMYDNTLSFDGVEIEGKSSIDLCRQACLGNDECEAFDFNNFLRQCFTHYDGFMDRLNPAADLVDQYRRLRCDTKTTPSGCVDRFIRYPDTLSVGGLKQTNANSAAACTQRCRETANCVAFDFNSKSKECFTHVPGFLANLLTAVDNVDGVDQYRWTPCADGTGATTYGPCIDTFERKPDTLAYNGKQQVSLTTLDKCMKSCRDTSYCIAFDFNQDNDECFFHADGYLDFVQEGVRGVDQYRRTACETNTKLQHADECEDTFSKYSDTLSYGGTKQDGADSSEKCRRRCLQQDTCVAYDFATVERTCYTHVAGYIEFVFSRSDGARIYGVDQYRREACNPEKPGEPDCVESFVKVSNTLSYGGTEQPADGTLDKCRALCVDVAECRAFDYDENEEKCFTHREGFEDRVLSRADGVLGVHQYRKQEGCDGDRTASLDCEETFERYPETLAYGGEAQLGANSVLRCSGRCEADPNCAAFDFSTQGNTCYTHEEGYLQQVYTQIPNVDQYRRVTICGSASPAPTCTDTFEKKANTMAFNGQEQRTARTVETCQDRCLDQADCAAFDWDRPTRRCYTHGPDYLSAVYTIDINDIDQYRRIPCNDSTVTSSSANDPRCAEPFVLEPFTLSYGGTQHIDVRTLLECQEVCLKLLTCRAFDFNNKFKECFTHEDGYIDTANSPVQDIDQYRRKDRC